jgi:hypothetical protein
MRAQLDRTSLLTGGERHLLEELLDRIANDVHGMSTGSITSVGPGTREVIKPKATSKRSAVPSGLGRLPPVWTQCPLIGASPSFDPYGPTVHIGSKAEDQGSLRGRVSRAPSVNSNWTLSVSGRSRPP